MALLLTAYMVRFTHSASCRRKHGNSMKEIEFSKDQKERMVDKVKSYFSDELQQDIGGFEAEFLIDFLARELGPYFYNRGLFDAQQVFNEKNEEAGYVIQELEKPEGY